MQTFFLTQSRKVAKNGRGLNSPRRRGGAERCGMGSVAAGLLCLHAKSNGLEKSFRHAALPMLSRGAAHTPDVRVAFIACFSRFRLLLATTFRWWDGSSFYSQQPASAGLPNAREGFSPDLGFTERGPWAKAPARVPQKPAEAGSCISVGAGNHHLKGGGKQRRTRLQPGARIKKLRPTSCLHQSFARYLKNLGR